MRGARDQPRRDRARGRHRPDGRDQRRPPSTDRRGVARGSSTSWRPGRSSAGDVPPPTLVLGAGLTYTALMSGRLAERLPALAAASRTVGSPQIRNAGTLGGNLGTASPAGDTLPVLAALDATVDLVSSSGERSLRLEEFITGPKRTARRSDELIASVRFPAPDGPQQFLKVGTRNAMVIAAVSLAAIVDRPTRSIRLALGAVGPTPIRAHDAEAWLADRLDWEMTTAPRPDPARRARPARLGVGPSDRRPPVHRRVPTARRWCAGRQSRQAHVVRRPAGRPLQVRRPRRDRARRRWRPWRGHGRRSRRRISPRRERPIDDGPRLVRQREPPVRPARATRSARRQGSVRAG